MASAKVGSPILGCQSLIGHWLAMMVAPAWCSEQEVIDNQELYPAQPGQCFEVRAVSPGLLQGLKQAGCPYIEHGIAGAGAGVTQGTGDKRLTDSGRPCDQDVKVSAYPLGIG